MRFEPRFDIYALFMLLGFFQGVFLAYFFLTRKNRADKSNLFWGLLLLTIALLSSEILLNYTGIIVKILLIENYSEPLIFLVPPLLYLIIKTRLGKEYEKTDWIHFFPFAFYFLYMFFYFLQTPEFKFNQYVYCYQPEWNFIETSMAFPDDPLDLRGSLKQLYISQFVIYGVLMFQLLREHKPQHTNGNNLSAIKLYKTLRGHLIHYIIILFIIIGVKMSFDRDLGDYIIGSYLSLLIYIASFIVLKNANLSSSNNKVGEEKPKYEKSSLSEEKKDEILQKIKNAFEQDKMYLQSSVSLSGVSKAINEATHHISQVINEKLGKSFFDILSDYRIEEAKKLLLNSENDKLTIEDIAEQVGYNSKAAFNKAFKKITKLTPSAFRMQK